MVNYYDLLGVDPSASAEEMKKKLKEKKRLWTVQQNASRLEQRQEAERNRSLIPKIQEIIDDETKRKEYDKKLKTSVEPEAEVDPEKIDANDLVKEGWHMIGEGNIPDALMIATRAIKEQEDNPDAWAVLGYARWRWGDVEDAIDAYKHAIKLRPNDAGFYFDLGMILEDLERWGDAMKQYQRAAKIDPSKTSYRAAMGSVFIVNDMYDEGVQLLEQCVKEEPDNQGYRNLLMIGYVAGATTSWHEEGDEVMPLSMEHIEAAEKRIEYAKKIDPGAYAENEDFLEQEKMVQSMKKRRFTGSWIVLIGALVLGMIGFTRDPFIGLYLTVGAVLYYISALTPSYQINKIIVKKGSYRRASTIMHAILFLVWPILVLVNFIANYRK